jgi:pyridoxine 5-phosphate synthase
LALRADIIDSILVKDLFSATPDLTLEIDVRGQQHDDLAVARALAPPFATLVAEDPKKDADRGLNVLADRHLLAAYVQELEILGTKPILFVEPDLEQIRVAKEMGIERIEICAKSYGQADEDNKSRIFANIQDAADAAHDMGLAVAVGHGLGYEEVEALAKIDTIDEFHIGRAIGQRATTVGLEEAVREMAQLVRR